MNKADLIDAVQKALGPIATRRAADDAVTAVLAAIVKGIKKDKKVQIVGFGTFEVKTRAERIGRNPQTKQPIQIPKSKSVVFRPAVGLKADL
ncbi:MAG: HU family DNA-binding protein [Akkermansiaceae bacterium]|nr:HU family DNA-binding protein [Akkermansiaceae bacterium]